MRILARVSDCVKLPQRTQCITPAICPPALAVLQLADVGVLPLVEVEHAHACWSHVCERARAPGRMQCAAADWVCVRVRVRSRARAFECQRE